MTVVAVNESYVFDFSADFHGGGGALDFEFFDDGDGIAIL